MISFCVKGIHTSLVGLNSSSQKINSNMPKEITPTCQIIVQQILLIFGEKNTYTTLLGPTRLLISEIFPSKPDFHLHK